MHCGIIALVFMHLVRTVHHRDLVYSGAYLVAIFALHGLSVFVHLVICCSYNRYSVHSCT